MTTKQIVHPGNNGNGKLNHLVNNPHFCVRTLVQDMGAYMGVILYIKDKAKKDKDGDYVMIAGGYVLDELGKEVVRINPLRKIIEMTKEVNPEIKRGIEEIIYQN